MSADGYGKIKQSKQKKIYKKTDAWGAPKSSGIIWLPVESSFGRVVAREFFTDERGRRRSLGAATSDDDVWWRCWGWMRGKREDSKEPDRRLVAKLASAGWATTDRCRYILAPNTLSRFHDLCEETKIERHPPLWPTKDRESRRCTGKRTRRRAKMRDDVRKKVEHESSAWENHECRRDVRKWRGAKTCNFEEEESSRTCSCSEARYTVLRLLEDHFRS